jgi:HEAT repeat protein
MTATTTSPLAFDELTARLYDVDPVVREAVASALASIFEGRPELVSEVSAERHGEGRPAYFKAILRFVACLELLALCKLEAPEAVETLGEVVMDSSVREEFRTLCAMALGTIGNASALPALEAVARAEPQGDVAANAREAIRRINA